MISPCPLGRATCAICTLAGHLFSAVGPPSGRRRGCGVAEAWLRGGRGVAAGAAEAWLRGRRAGAAAGWRRSEAAGAARAQKKPADCGRLSRITPLVSSSIEGARAVRTDGYGHRHPGVRMSEVEVPGGVSGIGGWLDDRLHGAGYMRTLMRKVFPDHWSFLLGEIALWSFVILLL